MTDQQEGKLTKALGRMVDLVDSMGLDREWFDEGATDDEIERAEQTLGAEFGPELREWFRFSNGLATTSYVPPPGVAVGFGSVWVLGHPQPAGRSVCEDFYYRPFPGSPEPDAPFPVVEGLYATILASQFATLNVQVTAGSFEPGVVFSNFENWADGPYFVSESLFEFVAVSCELLERGFYALRPIQSYKKRMPTADPGPVWPPVDTPAGFGFSPSHDGERGCIGPPRHYIDAALCEVSFAEIRDEALSRWV